VSNSVRHIVSSRGLDAALRQGGGRDSGAAPSEGDFAAVMNLVIDAAAGAGNGESSDSNGGAAASGGGHRFDTVLTNAATATPAVETGPPPGLALPSGSGVAAPNRKPETWRDAKEPAPAPLAARQASPPIASAVSATPRQATGSADATEQTLPAPGRIAAGPIATVAGDGIPQHSPPGRPETKWTQGISRSALAESSPAPDASTTPRLPVPTAAIAVATTPTTAAKFAPAYPDEAPPATSPRMASTVAGGKLRSSRLSAAVAAGSDHPKSTLVRGPIDSASTSDAGSATQTVVPVPATVTLAPSTPAATDVAPPIAPPRGAVSLASERFLPDKPTAVNTEPDHPKALQRASTTTAKATPSTAVSAGTVMAAASLGPRAAGRVASISDVAPVTIASAAPPTAPPGQTGSNGSFGIRSGGSHHQASMPNLATAASVVTATPAPIVSGAVAMAVVPAGAMESGRALAFPDATETPTAPVIAPTAPATPAQAANVPVSIAASGNTVTATVSAAPITTERVVAPIEVGGQIGSNGPVKIIAARPVHAMFAARSDTSAPADGPAPFTASAAIAPAIVPAAPLLSPIAPPTIARGQIQPDEPSVASQAPMQAPPILMAIGPASAGIPQALVSAAPIVPPIAAPTMAEGQNQADEPASRTTKAPMQAVPTPGVAGFASVTPSAPAVIVAPATSNTVAGTAAFPTAAPIAAWPVATPALDHGGITSGTPVVVSASPIEERVPTASSRSARTTGPAAPHKVPDRQPRLGGGTDSGAPLASLDSADNGDSIAPADGSPTTGSATGQRLASQSTGLRGAVTMAAPVAPDQAQPNVPTDSVGIATPSAPQAAAPNATSGPDAPITAAQSRRSSDGRISGVLSAALPASGGTIDPGTSRQDSIQGVSATSAVAGAVPAANGNIASPAAPDGALLRGDNGNAAAGDAQTTSFGTAMANHVAAMIASGHRETTLQLQPPQLGELTVRVSVQGRDVSTWFSAPQQQVQLAVSQALDQLRSGLSGAGLNLAGAWVGADASAMPQRSFDNPIPAARRSSFAPISPAAPATDAADGARSPSGLSVYV
jgi:hypothetical protein